MEIRTIEEMEGSSGSGYVVEMLGQVDYRPLRHEACERAMAILEEEVDDLKQVVERLVREVQLCMLKSAIDRELPGGLPPAAKPRKHDTALMAAVPTESEP